MATSQAVLDCTSFASHLNFHFTDHHARVVETPNGTLHPLKTNELPGHWRCANARGINRVGRSDAGTAVAPRPCGRPPADRPTLLCRCARLLNRVHWNSTVQNELLCNAGVTGIRP